MKRELERICALNPENLGAATSQGFLFKYIDISSVEKGCIHWDQVSRYKFSEAPSRARRRARKDDVLLCTVRPALQAHARISKEDDIPFVASTGFTALRPYNKEDSSFVFHQIFSNDVVAQLRSKEVGSSYPAVNESDVRRLSIYMPESSQRKAIGKVLDTIDEVIDQTEAVIAKLKQVQAGMLHDLLSYGLDEHGQLRDPIAHPEQFKDSPLGLIPKEWDVKPLSSVCQKIADRDHTTPVYVDDGIKMVSPIHFKGDDEIDFEACPRIARDAHRKNCLKTDIRAGDLILHRIGAGLGQIRRVTPDMPEFSILHSLALVRTTPERITADFLYWVIQSNAVKTQITLGIQSIGVPDLGLDKIGNLLVLVPHNLDEQTKIAQRLSLVADSLKKETSALNKAKHLKLGLQDDLLTGRVRVPETIMNPQITQITRIKEGETGS